MAFKATGLGSECGLGDHASSENAETAMGEMPYKTVQNVLFVTAARAAEIMESSLKY